jgi:hypothetical protein
MATRLPKDRQAAKAVLIKRLRLQKKLFMVVVYLDEMVADAGVSQISRQQIMGLARSSVTN